MAKKPKAQPSGDVIADIIKKYGEGAIIQSDVIKNYPSVPTGILNFDISTAVGGLPAGKLIEIFGAESSGKTTLSLHCIAAFQRAGYQAAFVDAEHAINYDWAWNLGVNVDNLYISQPDYGEQALDIVQMLAASGKVGLVVVDSVAALVPKAELDGELTDANIGIQARMISKALRKLVAVANKSNCTIIFINQIREKIGVMFGNPETTPGGRALRFYSSMRVKVSRRSLIKVPDSDSPIGVNIVSEIVKNKVARPGRGAAMEIYFGDPEIGHGIISYGALLTYGSELGILTLKGSHYSHDGEVLGNGRINAMKALKERPELVESIRNAMMDKECPDRVNDFELKKIDSVVVEGSEDDKILEDVENLA